MQDYIGKIERSNIDKGHRMDKKTELNKWGWITDQTRPDISFDI